MKTERNRKFALALGVLAPIVFWAATFFLMHHHNWGQRRSAEPKPIRWTNDWSEYTAQIAREHNLAVLSEEIRKAHGTNLLFSADIQQVLTEKKRFAADCKLHDLIRSETNLQAVFTFESKELIGPEDKECVLKLDCPADLAKVLASHRVYGRVSVAFEAVSCRGSLEFSPSYTLDASAAAVDFDRFNTLTVLTVEGRLIGVVGDE